MALMKCPECGGQVSDKAGSCPHCGCPVARPAPKLQPAPRPQPTPRPQPSPKPQAAEPAQEEGGVATKTKVVLGSVCLILLLLFGLAAWGYFQSDMSVQEYITHLMDNIRAIPGNIGEFIWVIIGVIIGGIIIVAVCAGALFMLGAALMSGDLTIVLIVVVIVGLVGLIGVPQFAAYRMRAYNWSAESDLRNLKTAQEVLMGDFSIYGSTMRGKLPGSGKASDAVMLEGPLNPAVEAEPGAMVSGVGKDGKAQGVGIGVGNAVQITARSARAKEGVSYIALSKHLLGNRVFAADSDSTDIYYCENKEWVGKGGIPATYSLEAQKVGVDDFNGKACGGSPKANWQPLKK